MSAVPLCLYIFDLIISTLISCCVPAGESLSGTPLTTSARISALNIVGELLRKVGVRASLVIWTQRTEEKFGVWKNRLLLFSSTGDLSCDAAGCLCFSSQTNINTLFFHGLLLVWKMLYLNRCVFMFSNVLQYEWTWCFNIIWCFIGMFRRWILSRQRAPIWSWRFSSLYVEPGVEAGVVSGVRQRAEAEPQRSRWRTGSGVGPEQLLRDSSYQRPLQQGVSCQSSRRKASLILHILMKSIRMLRKRLPECFCRSAGWWRG